MLHNLIVRDPGVHLRDAVERDTEAEEIEDFVEEGAAAWLAMRFSFIALGEDRTHKPSPPPHPQAPASTYCTPRSYARHVLARQTFRQGSD